MLNYFSKKQLWKFRDPTFIILQVYKKNYEKSGIQINVLNMGPFL